MSSVEITIKKERKKVNQNKRALVPKTNSMRKEEGATVAASHLPSLSWLSHQARPAAFYNELPLPVGKSHKLPKMSY